MSGGGSVDVEFRECVQEVYEGIRENERNPQEGIWPIDHGSELGFCLSIFDDDVNITDPNVTPEPASGGAPSAMVRERIVVFLDGVVTYLKAMDSMDDLEDGEWLILNEAFSLLDVLR